MDEGHVIRALIRLNEQEAEILYWTCTGLNRAEVGNKIAVSASQVYNLLQVIYGKLEVLGVEQVDESVCRALENLIGSPPDFTNWPPEIEDDNEPIPIIEPEIVEPEEDDDPVVIEQREISPWFRLVVVAVTAVVLLSAGAWAFANFIGGDEPPTPPDNSPVAQPTQESTEEIAELEPSTDTPELPTNIPQPTETLEPPTPVPPSATPSATSTPSMTPSPTETLPPTETPTLTPTPLWYEEEQLVSITNGVFIWMQRDFGHSYGSCNGTFQQTSNGFFLDLPVENSSSRQFRLSFRKADVRVVDNLGNEFDVLKAGINRCNENNTAHEELLDTGDSVEIQLFVLGNISNQADYLLVSLQDITGYGSFTFQKLTR